ncbi:MAG: hypothetical protein ACYSTI_10050, partial [Planctomycetota bacterium]
MPNKFCFKCHENHNGECGEYWQKRCKLAERKAKMWFDNYIKSVERHSEYVKRSIKNIRMLRESKRRWW